MSYFSVVTTIGLTKMAAAASNGTDLVLAFMAAGDGGGLPVTPNISMTALVNEWYRTPNISISTTGTNQRQFEFTVPSTSGGYTIREFGLFDADGDLIAISNCPDTYKPAPAEASKYVVLRLVLETANASTLSVTIDPDVVMASTAYVNEHVATHAALTATHGITGAVVGTTDSQALTNKTIAAANNTISGLTHGTHVDSPSSGVHGVTGAVVGTSDAQILTNKDIDGGTASNASRIVVPKAATATLSGLTRKEGALVYDTTEKAAKFDTGASLRHVGMPAGSLLPFAGRNVPAGYLACDGSEVSKTEHWDLWEALQDETGLHGVWDRCTNPLTGAQYDYPTNGYFRLPDLRSAFLRGTGAPSGLDTVALAGYQANKTARNGLSASAAASSVSGSITAASDTHTHNFRWFATSTSADGVNYYQEITGGHSGPDTGPYNYEVTKAIVADTHSHTMSYSLTAAAQSIAIGAGDAETRPNNVGVNYIIKF